ncbi:class I SAM-dependent methyltransferase [Candidatus Gracilibacteria bacterium]|nr:class I SAM-dependent methyltransferase [Candidatus Gracilibacteria bacterium]
MKKTDSKKPYAYKSKGSVNSKFGRPIRGDKTISSRPYNNKKSSSSYAAKAPYGVRKDKPVYKGKEDRLAGGKTRNETRVYSGYSAHTPRSYSKPTINSKEIQTINHKPVTAVDTSWGGVADWYNKHLEKGDDTYHTKVIFPNILRMLGDVTGKKILDMACGQGIFAEQLRDKGAFVTGVDVAKELIKLAEENSQTIKQKGTHKVIYHVSSAEDMSILKDSTFDIVVCILALQNMENLQKTISEAKRVLTSNGKLFLVLNHPSFRNPKQTYWGYNENDDMQYRRVDEYMSESHVRIDMTPGSPHDKKFTVSFHRPLQVYVKALAKSGLGITRLEEWVSHRESERGSRKKAEDKARKEIPLFMCIESKVNSL